MTDQELIRALHEHAEWAQANEWEAKITLGDDITAAANLIESQKTHIGALQMALNDVWTKLPLWIPVKERLPEPETEVLAVCDRNGFVFIAPVIYEDGKMLTQDSSWNWTDIYEYGLYNEETDDYEVSMHEV